MPFNYINKNYHEAPQRKNHFSSTWFKKISVVSFLTASFCLLIGKVWIRNKESTSYHRSETPVQKFQKISLPSVVVNFQSSTGPRLARVIVQLTTQENSVKKEILSQKKSFNKHLLLILSGQKTQDLQSKKKFFENKIKTQMNAFLSKGLINQVSIQTQWINATKELL